MRRLLVAVPLALVLAGSADARDRWSGFYIGGNLGYANADASADFALPGVPTAFNASERLEGATYGAQAGYNRQMGSLVLGVEAEIMGTSQKAASTRVCPTAACGIAITQTSQDKIPWLGTLRARVGVAAGSFLIYATGGIGFGEFESTQTLTTGLGSVTSTRVEQDPALVLGAGVEAAINSSWSAKAEYLYFDTKEFNTTYNLAGVGVVTQTSRMTNDIIRLGVNYRF